MMSSSSSSATVRVDKATSDLLIGPDWTMNIDICDSINSNQWQGKEVVKALKKRLLHKNPKVQLLALTLLETMIKNCGEFVHFQIAERHILQEMVKIVRKKADMQVRDKILDLLDSWQEAFGGPGGKYPQYYWSYEELRAGRFPSLLAKSNILDNRSGVEFPERSRDAAPIFTPPVTNPLTRHSQTGYGMPSNTSIRLDEAMASESENLSLSNLDSMRSVMELLADMLQAVNPNNPEEVKDEIIADLVTQCRSNQKKLMQMLTSTGDEELLCQGLALNDSLQSLLVKHDAIASGSPLPVEVRDHSSPPRSTTERQSSGPRSTTEVTSNANPASPIAIITSSQLEEEEEEEDDDFAQLARRRSKTTQVIPPSETTESVASSDTSSCNALALALPDPPNPVRTTKEEDLIDLLSMTLSTSSMSSPQPQPQPHTPLTPSSTSNQAPVSPVSQQGYFYTAPPYPGYQPPQFNNYVAPWAQQPPPPPPLQSQPQPLNSYNYPPPPWATNGNPASTTTTTTTGYQPLQSYNSFPVQGERQVNSTQQQVKPFVPSYRLFEDLNVLGNSDGGHKSSSGGPPNLSGGMTGQSMVGGRK